MKKKSKRFNKLKDVFPEKKMDTIEKLIPMVKKTSNAKFDESIDLSMRLNLNQSKTETNIRTIVNLPYGLGKKIKVAVICEENKTDEAKNSGADLFGSDDLIAKISKGEINFDKVLATSGMMAKVGKLGKVLGPKGLMPNPKLGTVTNNLKSSVQALKTGQIEIKSDKDGNLATSIGKKSFPDEKLIKNFEAILEVLFKEKPDGIKGHFVLSSFLTSTMGISYKLKFKGI